MGVYQQPERQDRIPAPRLQPQPEQRLLRWQHRRRRDEHRRSDHLRELARVRGQPPESQRGPGPRRPELPLQRLLSLQSGLPTEWPGASRAYPLKCMAVHVGSNQLTVLRALVSLEAKHGPGGFLARQIVDEFWRQHEPLMPDPDLLRLVADGDVHAIVAYRLKTA